MIKIKKIVMPPMQTFKMPSMKQLELKTKALKTLALQKQPMLSKK
jgi:hypothetical protein